MNPNKRYEELFKSTRLTTSQIITQISLETGRSERTLDKIIVGAYRGGKKGRPRKAAVISPQKLVEMVQEHLKKGDSINTAAQRVAIELGLNRVSVLRRYRRVVG